MNFCSVKCMFIYFNYEIFRELNINIYNIIVDLLFPREKNLEISFF